MLFSVASAGLTENAMARAAVAHFPIAPIGRSGLGVGRDLHFHDLVRIAHRLAALEAVDEFHAGSHLAPHRILLVEEARIAEADEELAVGRVRTGRARHRADATHMRLPREFRL